MRVIEMFSDTIFQTCSSFKSYLELPQYLNTFSTFISKSGDLKTKHINMQRHMMHSTAYPFDKVHPLPPQGQILDPPVCSIIFLNHREGLWGHAKQCSNNKNNHYLLHL